MENKVSNKSKCGRGSLSFIISIFVIIFSCYHANSGITLAEVVLGPTLPNGIISLLLCWTSIYLSNKYPNHKYSKLGMKLSIIFLGLFVFGIIITLISTII